MDSVDKTWYNSGRKNRLPEGGEDGSMNVGVWKQTAEQVNGRICRNHSRLGRLFDMLICLGALTATLAQIVGAVRSAVTVLRHVRRYDEN